MPGPYKCSKCGRASTSSIKCSFQDCKQPAGKDPFPEYKETKPTINIKPTSKSSASVGGQPQATTGTATATRDLINDKPTKVKFDEIVVSSRRASVGKGKSSDSTDGRNGSGGASGQTNTTPKQPGNAGKAQAAEKSPTAQWNDYIGDVDKAADSLLAVSKLDASNFNQRMKTYHDMFEKNQASGLEALGNYLNELKFMQQEAGIQDETESLGQEAAAERERLAEAEQKAKAEAEQQRKQEEERLRRQEEERLRNQEQERVARQQEEAKREEEARQERERQEAVRRQAEKAAAEKAAVEKAAAEKAAAEKSQTGTKFTSIEDANAKIKEADTTVRQANKTIREAPQKQFDALHIAVVDLGNLLIADGLLQSNTLKNNVEQAKREGADTGLAILEKMWNTYKGKKEEATAQVQQGQKWQQYATQTEALEQANLDIAQAVETKKAALKAKAEFEQSGTRAESVTPQSEERKPTGEETSRKQQAEETAARKRQEEELKHLEQEAADKKLREAEQRRKEQEDADRLRKEQEDQARQEEARRLAEEKERKRQEDEERQRRQAEQERADAIRNYTSGVEKEVLAALVEGNADPERVKAFQKELQTAVDRFEDLRKATEATGQQIQGAINAIDQPLKNVQQAKRLAGERAEAFKKYTTDLDKAVKESLKKGNADVKAVTDARGDLQKAVNGLTKVTEDEARPAQEIKDALRKIDETLELVRLAGQEAEAAEKAAGEEAEKKQREAPKQTPTPKTGEPKASYTEAIKTVKSAKVAESAAGMLAGFDAAIDLGAQADENLRKADETIQAADEKLKAAEDVLRPGNSTAYKHAEQAIGDILDEFNKVFRGEAPQPSQAVLDDMDTAFELGNTERAAAQKLWNEQKDYAGALKLLMETLEKLKAVHKETAEAAAANGTGASGLAATLANKEQARKDKAEAEVALARARDEKTEAEKQKAEAELAPVAKARLLEAIQFGPLSKAPPTPEAEQATVEILKSFKDFPNASAAALDLVGRSPHPEVLAAGVKAVGPLEKSGFATKEGVRYSADAAREMARNALEMGGQLGGDYFERMNAYYSADKHAKKDPLDKSGDDWVTRKGAAYTRSMAAKLIDANGTVKFDDAAFKDVRDNLHFHPGSLQTPLLALATHVESVREAFINGPDGTTYANTIRDLAVPSAGAKGLIALTLNETSEAEADLAQAEANENAAKKAHQEKNTAETRKQQEEATKAVEAARAARDRAVEEDKNRRQGANADEAKGSARVALMSALLLPFNQGQVASCFATAPCRKLHKSKPTEYLNHLKQMVTTGELEIGGEPKLPVVTKVPKNGNAVLDSYQYTVATIGARMSNSNEKERLSKVLFGGSGDQVSEHSLDALQSEFGDEWDEKKQRIDEAIARNFVFTYDPLVARTDAADGSSTSGAFVMKRKQAVGEKDVTEANFQESLKEIVGKALIPDNKPNPKLKSKIDDLIDSNDFKNVLLNGYKSEGKIGSPWELPGGGQDKDSTKLLFGGDPTAKPLFKKDTTTGANQAEALVSSFLTNLHPEPGKDMVVVGVKGIHSMNVLPNHPTQQKLRQGDPHKDREKQVKESKEIAQKPLPTEHAQYLFAKALDGGVKSLFGGGANGTQELAEFMKQAPTTAMKPGELKQHILEKCQGKIAAKIEADMAKAEKTITSAIAAKVKDKKNVVKKYEDDLADFNDKQPKYTKAKKVHDAAMEKYRIEKEDFDRQWAEYEPKKELYDKALAEYKVKYSEYDRLFDERTDVINRYNAAKTAEERERIQIPPLPETPVAPVAPTAPAKETPPAKPKNLEMKEPKAPVDPGAVNEQQIELETRQKHREKVAKTVNDTISNQIDTVLLKELDYPEVVLIDTNWGSVQDNTLMAVLPDPSTGEMTLWKKGELQGSYSRETPDWLEKEWETTE